MTGQQTVKFAFKKAGVAACTTSDLLVTPNDNGQFIAAIPLAGCPSSLFDGSDVKIDIAVGGNLAIVDQSITPIPTAKFAEQLGFPDCPSGYDLAPSTAGIVLCKRGYDEVVRVGTKTTAFWIDRYEGSVWSDAAGTATQFGDNAIDFPVDTGGQSPGRATMYAVSKANVRPSRYVTWFQANVACRASGKRLPTGDEWLLAAKNTPDPGFADGTHGECNTGGNMHKNGEGTACISEWGAEDMIGNLIEWTAEWQAAPSIPERSGGTTWGAAMGKDSISNVASGSYPLYANWSGGMPAAIARGGSVYFGEGAGIFTYTADFAPNYADGQTSFRCVIPR